MQWGTSAEGDHRESGKVLTVLDRVDSRRVRHVLVDDLGDTDRCRLGIHFEGLTDGGLNCCGGLVRGKRYVCRPEGVGVQPPEREVGVSDGGFGSTEVIGGRAGFGSCAVRADSDLSQRVDAGDRTASSPYLDHLDDRDADGHARCPF